MRSVLTLLVGGGVLLGSGTALAQEGKALGSRESFVLSLEHLGGYSYGRFKLEGSDDALTSHQFGLFTPFLGPLGSHARLGLHYFVSPPLSIGGLLSYSDNDMYGTFVLAGARVGVALPMSESASLWLRGGIAYTNTSVDFFGQESSYTAFVPGGEVLIALKPLDHFGFLIGGMFEMAVGGKYEATAEDFNGQTVTQKQDYEQMEAGLTFGVFLDF